MSKIYQISDACYLRPWLGSPLAALGYVMSFRFVDDVRLLPIMGEEKGRN